MQITHGQQAAFNTYREPNRYALLDDAAVHIAAVISHKTGRDFFFIGRDTDHADHRVQRPHHVIGIPMHQTVFNPHNMRPQFTFFTKRTAFGNRTYRALVSYRNIQNIDRQRIARLRAFDVKRTGRRIRMLPIHRFRNIRRFLHLTVIAIFGDKFDHFTRFSCRNRLHLGSKLINTFSDLLHKTSSFTVPL